jgi:hypothetical protein
LLGCFVQRENDGFASLLKLTEVGNEEVRETGSVNNSMCTTERLALRDPSR